jgi:chromatin segregation and condensation protein Rec8/ScpA/Scc1 (kleisin family)
MEKNLQKPFYLRPPWNILFDLYRLQKINPWNLNISFLLISFLEEMEKRAEIDFRASGVALDSSASIYLMKSKLLLQLGTPLPTLKSKPEKIFPPLILPLRYELTTTTIQNLLSALDETLKKEKMFSLRVPLKAILPPPPEIIPTISAYLIEIEEQMEKLVQKICILAEKSELITFQKLVNKLDKIEIMRTFIVLLFMAHKGKIIIWQKEDFEEIYITLKQV